MLYLFMYFVQRNVMFFTVFPIQHSAKHFQSLQIPNISSTSIPKEFTVRPSTLPHNWQMNKTLSLHSALGDGLRSSASNLPPSWHCRRPLPTFDNRPGIRTVRKRKSFTLNYLSWMSLFMYYIYSTNNCLTSPNV